MSHQIGYWRLDFDGANKGGYMQQINVIKRDGTKEPFDANKINAAILKACDGLPDQVSKVVQVATELLNQIGRASCRERV